MSIFDDIFNNAKSLIGGGKTAVTPSFDVSTKTTTPMLAKPDTNMFGLKNDSTGGVITNTITGLPKGLYDVSKKVVDTGSEIPGQVANSLIGLGGDIVNAFKKPKDQVFQIPAPFGLDKLPGFGKTVKTKAQNIAEGEQTLKGYGLGKASLPLAFGGTIGSTFLDLTPFGGEKKAVQGFTKGVPEAFWKFVAKTADKKVLEDTFIKIGVKDKNIIKDLVEASAPTKTAREAQSAIESTWNNRIKNIEAPKSFNDFHPDDQKFLSGYADSIKAGNGKSIVKDTEIAKKTIESYGLKAPEDAKQIASQIDLMKTGASNATDVAMEKAMSARAGAGVPADIASKNNVFQTAQDIISKGKEAAIPQPRDVAGKFDYKTKIPTANTTAQITKTSSRTMDGIIPPKPPASVSIVDKIKNAYKKSPLSNQGGFIRVPGFGDEAPKIDQLIADGKVKVNREGTKDVYSYQKGGVWQRARDEDSAVKGALNIRPTRLSAEGIPLATPAKFKRGLQTEQISKSPLDMATQAPSRKASSLATGEARSLETSAEQSASGAIRDPQLKKNVSLPRIIEKSQTPVKAKVNALDYMRTPENVLKKIGLSKEADAVRLAYDGYVKELPKNIDKISEWAKSLPKESNVRIFKYLDGQAIALNPSEAKVAGEIKDWLKTWADRLGLPEDNRIADYITHIFDDQLLKKEFDEDLAKIIADKVPGSVYNPFLQARLGAKGYRQDTWAALDAYVKRATRKVHLDPALSKLEDASRGLEESQWNYVKRYADRVNMRPTEMDNLVDNAIKSVIGYRAGQRPVAQISKMLRRTTYRGMLGLNAGSALRNLSQGINTYAKLGEKYTAIGYSKLFSKANRAELEASGVLSQAFVQDRALSAAKKTMEKVDKGLFYMFEKAEMINRGAAYFGAKSKAIAQGMTEEKAVEYAKKIVRDTQFQFGSIDTPVAMSSDIVKTLTQFQSFTTKQIEFLAGMAKNKEYAGLIRYVLSGLIFVYTIGQAFGMKPEDLIPLYRLGIPPSLKLPGTAIQAISGGNATGADVLNTLPGYIPAGIQAKKTIEGAQAIKQGGSYDAAGRLQFAQGQSAVSKAQALLFGKYSSSQAQDYFNRGSISKEEKSKVQPIYDQAQEMIKNGDEAGATDLVNQLSTPDYETYKKIKAADTAQKTQSLKKDVLPTYNEAQKLIKSGDASGAQALVDGLTDEQYKAYQLVKKDQEKLQQAQAGQKPTFDPNEVASDRSVIETVWTYAKALGTDPVTAFNRIFTGQRIKYVTNGTVVVDRLPLAESQAEKKRQGSTGAEVKLDHTLPLQLGGSNDKGNLKLVPTSIWASYTPVEDALGTALRNGNITKAVAQSLIKDFKEGNITAQDVYNSIKQ